MGYQMTKSFYDWCVENNKQILIDRWDFQRNKCSPKDIAFSTKQKYYFKCLVHPEHHSEEFSLEKIVYRKNQVRCKQCNSFAQYGIDKLGKDFLEKYWDYDKNVGINPWCVCHNGDIKVYIKCQNNSKHGSYPISTAHFYEGKRCPYCSGNSGKVIKEESLGYLYPQVLDIWSDKNIKSPYEYAPYSHSKVWIKCEKHKHVDNYCSVYNLINVNFRCPKCSREEKYSILQNKVSKYISSKYFKDKLLHENYCTLVPHNPKNNYPLPFDNELIIEDKHLIIEVNGFQHYEICIFNEGQAEKNHTTPEYELHKQQLHDRYKKYIAYVNGYEYLAIPYWTDDKDESYKTLIDDKINEILNIYNTQKKAS